MTARSLSGLRPTRLHLVLEYHRQLVGVLDHVVVGHNATVGVKHEARPDAGVTTAVTSAPYVERFTPAGTHSAGAGVVTMDFRGERPYRPQDPPGKNC